MLAFRRHLDKLLISRFAVRVRFPGIRAGHRMMEDLCSCDWRYLAELWRAVSECPAGNAEPCLERAAAMLGEMLHGVDTIGSIVARPRRGSARDPLGGFRGKVELRGTRESWRARVGADWLASEGHLADPTLQRLARGAGRPRVIGLRTTTGAKWHATPLGDLAQALKVSDRLLGAAPLAPGLELVVAVDRDSGDRPFSARDEARMQCALDGFVTTARRVARRHGLVDGERQLAPRERDVLDALLQGASEREVAKQLGISAGTAHQYAVRLYRVFNVHSRAELLAHFLHELTLKAS